MKQSILTIAIFLLLVINCLLPSFSFAQFTTLFNFAGYTNGSYPYGSLISDGTFLYGMTADGGTAGTCISGCGTIFKIKPDGTGYAKLLDFADTAYGSNPYGSLVSDGTFFYGMTQHGGTNDNGVIFKIKPDGTGYSKLLNFSSTANGLGPQGSLITDGTFLYGMTAWDGTSGVGTIFKIKLDGTGYIKLLDFDDTASGKNPNGDLLSVGNFLYGMTHDGGTNNSGLIFKIKPDGTAFSVLHEFGNGTDGGYPNSSLISDGTFLYGMTAGGGTNGFSGVIFKIKPDGSDYSKLFDFSGIATGSDPLGSLISDGTFLYGMTGSGGTNGDGVVFKIKPNGTGYAKLFDFDDILNGSFPNGSLISDSSFLYGMTANGNTNDYGTIFKYDISTGITENIIETGFNISPNPFTSQTTISFNEEQKNSAIKILDVLGKEVKSINFTGKQFVLEKGEMQAGIYFLQLIDENKNVVNKKIAVQ